MEGNGRAAKALKGRAGKYVTKEPREAAEQWLPRHQSEELFSEKAFSLSTVLRVYIRGFPAMITVYNEFAGLNLS